MLDYDAFLVAKSVNLCMLFVIILNRVKIAAMDSFLGNNQQTFDTACGNDRAVQ